jgi:hypothetical protein
MIEISSYPCEFLGLRDLIIFSCSFVVENLRFVLHNELSKANMATSGGEQCIVSKSGKVTYLQCKVTKGASIKGEYYPNKRINEDQKELLNLQDDMKELSNLLKIVARSSVKEVIQHKVNVILVKMASIIEDSVINEEYNSCWNQVKNGKSKADRKQYYQYMIPVTNNRYRLLENQEGGYENVSLDALDREHQRTW